LAGPGDSGRCFACLKRRDQVAMMFKVPRSYFTLHLCNECVEDMHKVFNEIIARPPG
jgi:hypothetical protein